MIHRNERRLEQYALNLIMLLLDPLAFWPTFRLIFFSSMVRSIILSIISQNFHYQWELQSANSHHMLNSLNSQYQMGGI